MPKKTDLKNIFYPDKKSVTIRAGYFIIFNRKKTRFPYLSDRKNDQDHDPNRQ